VQPDSKHLKSLATPQLHTLQVMKSWVGPGNN